MHADSTGSLAPAEIRGHEIFSVLRNRWVISTPEERVRQDYLRTLVNAYGYALEQIAEEASVAGRGSARARADFLIWRSVDSRLRDEHALIVVECKAESVGISLSTYMQGANYAQYEHAPFFVTHNSRETKFWRVQPDRRMPNFDEIEDIPSSDASEADIQWLLTRLRAFREDEFADLLHECHNVIRNREKRDPAAAFDEIAKLLFIKVAIERRLQKGRQRRNLFTAAFLDEQAQFHDDPVSVLFDQTKKEYRADHLFSPDERVNLKLSTVREIVRLLERYNLSDTSEDIKGIAFERFLGRTFRGEIGQFFTPRTIVTFMVEMVDPSEDDVICDPAAGSGGFLIRAFELVKQKILYDVDRQYEEFKSGLSGANDRAAADLLNTRYEELQRDVDPAVAGSRMWTLANGRIFGTDANERMARTSKMNMIMHGDGHGGVHHHDGLLNVDGIFEERFDLVLTNPPFGSRVEASDVVLRSDVDWDEDLIQRYSGLFGESYRHALARSRDAIGKPIASLFTLGRGNRARTELLFLERCLRLLRPGGRMGIVLPEGVFNNPSLEYVRRFVEEMAYVDAIVSLPQETFVSAGASVKASVLFLTRFTEAEVAARKSFAQKIEADFRQDPSNTEADIPSHVEQSVRKQFDYDVFVYDAQHVGITATGEPTDNELYPNPDQPADMSQTAVELYRAHVTHRKRRDLRA